MLNTEPQQQLEFIRDTSRSTFDTVIKQDARIAQAAYRDPWPSTLAAFRQCTSPSHAGRDTPHHVSTPRVVRPTSSNHSLGRVDARTCSLTVLERQSNLTIAVA